MTRKSLGDKFREAAGMIADGKECYACLALQRAPDGNLHHSRARDLFVDLYKPDTVPSYLAWMGEHLDGGGRDHRIIALLLAAAMADTGDLK